MQEAKNTSATTRQLQLPKRFLALLEKDLGAESDWNIDQLLFALRCCSEWLASRPEMHFFPDFTDHGVSHLQRVLDLCDFLIADYEHPRQSSWQALTPSDAAALIQAVLLHDLAMHLDIEGFQALLEGDSTASLAPGAGLVWAEEWEDFLAEAKRWDERKIGNVYGTLLSECLDRPAFRRPDLSCELDKMDRLLIGEFLRRHHPAIALDISVGRLSAAGLPSMPLSGKLAEISGLIAKSHGEPIRAAVTCAEQRLSNVRFISKVHVVYLMAVLRIADYLHLHAERAPGNSSDISKRSSPISRREFLSHQAIEDIHFDNHPDRESVYVELSDEETRLTKASTLLNIRDGWLDGIASELNQAWGEIGRAYSRFPTMGNLGLTVRRVDSNVWEEHFTAKLGFYPYRASFRSADSDFLKLLVAPLYGARPEVGIRELIQNAIDAVRERRQIEVSKGMSGLDWQPIGPGSVDADVLISLCRRSASTPLPEKGGPPLAWEYWVEVQDRGVGMTSDTVINYFLVAGASFRRSMTWKKAYQDEHGTSRVLRSGRFGVGALAAFLLGNEIEVTTKHLSADEGVRFKAEITDEQVDLQRRQASVGTTIRVDASVDAVTALFERGWDYDWDWYHLAWPKLVRRKQLATGAWKVLDCEDEDEGRLDERVLLPCPNEDALPTGWRSLSAPGYSAVHWTFNQGVPSLVCNGITIIRDSYRREWDWSRDSSGKRRIGLKMPSVSVFDPDGILPLTLARDGLAVDALPFEEQLLNATARDCLAHALVCGPSKHLAGGAIHAESEAAHPASKAGGYVETPYYLSMAEGFALADPHILAECRIQKLIFVISFEKGRKLPTVKPQLGEAVFGVRYGGDLHGADGKVEWLAQGLGYSYARLRPHVSQRDNPFASMPVLGLRVLCRASLLRDLERDTGRSFATDSPAVHKTLGGKLWIVDSTADLPPIESSVCWRLSQQKGINERAELGMVVEVLVDSGKKMDQEPSALAKAWGELIAAPFIPYKQAQRELSLTDAFEQLSPELEIWRHENNQRLKEKGKQLEAKRKGLSVGGYPAFRHANQVKLYLKNKGVERRVRVIKQDDRMQLYEGPRFTVYVAYSRQELIAVNASTPITGNPFDACQPYDLLPDYLSIQHALGGSNVFVRAMSPVDDAEDESDYEDV